jgi:hypothetical protein
MQKEKSREGAGGGIPLYLWLAAAADLSAVDRAR